MACRKETNGSNSSIAQKLCVRIPCVGIITVGFLNHPRNNFFLSIFILGDVLLCPQEPGDGQDYVKIVEGWQVVEADSAQSSSHRRNYILEIIMIICCVVFNENE